MSTASSSSIVLHADQEHDNLRTAVILFLITAFFLSYWLVYAILQADFWGSVRDYAVSLSCVLGLVLALAISAGFEVWLKRVWHSGRRLTLDENSIHIQDKLTNEQTINLTNNVSHLQWQFNLHGYRRGGREKRLSANWVCLAYQLQQGETRLIVHSYLPPQKAQVWLEDGSGRPQFHKINPGDVYESSLSSRFGAPSRPVISNEVLSNSDGRYWLAERHRWDEGFELTPHDFAIFMNKVTELQNDKATK
ncbi:MAG: hypothetical protein H6667_03475 [Ardenticatenaceae bacterium]|nr:hypothetical protein [Ardenticatenaceae bacterium]MCB9443069.1 hypothetical protein [Ardenticatenaceae bacterium]